MAHKAVVVTRPNSDDTTRYLSSWAGKIIEAAERKGIDVIDLSKDRAVKKVIEGVINKVNPSFVFLNGHGSKTSVAGQNNEVLIEAGINEGLLAGRITYAVACQSATALGPKSVVKLMGSATINVADNLIREGGQPLP